MEKQLKFTDLGLSTQTLEALSKKGFEEPTAIQAKCIPILLQDKADIVGMAQTGTGKTAAFGLPIIELVKPELRQVQAIILTPTRELAIQVTEELNSLKGEKKLKIATIYGGQSIYLQVQKLKDGVHIVVGTPGRVIDHLAKKKLDLSHLSFFILDEADEMLNMGFVEEIENILQFTPEKKRMLLFSATMPQRILNLAKKYMPKYEYIEIKKNAATTNLTDQIYFEVAEHNKFEALSRIIDIETDFYGLIFCRTKVDVDTVVRKLIDRGYSVQGVHGDIMQSQREKILKQFKDKKIKILIATDVAARGIDVNDLTHVINYSLPQDPESYTHRIGRTGRAGKQGTAITFITPFEYRKLAFIQQRTRSEIRKEKVPNIQQVIAIKKNRIMNDIDEILISGEQKYFETFAVDILKDHDPKEVIAALLKHSYQDKLDEKSYSEIKEFSAKRVDRKPAFTSRRDDFRQNDFQNALVDKAGKTRLFVAKGKNHNMTAPKIIEYIVKTAKVKSSTLHDLQVYDDFSFVSVPFIEAEIILKAFRKKPGERPAVVKAKEKN